MLELDLSLCRSFIFTDAVIIEKKKKSWGGACYKSNTGAHCLYVPLTKCCVTYCEGHGHISQFWHTESFHIVEFTGEYLKILQKDNTLRRKTWGSYFCVIHYF